MATTSECLQTPSQSSLTSALSERPTPYPYTLLSANSKPTVQLCPPHWRKIPKRRFRSKLKDLVLKKTGERPQEQRSGSVQKRPIVMRMKDSDDYITARFANPRTGLISPSIGSPSPQGLCTPNAPGDALERAAVLDPSPTPAARPRPTLSRANEGRKISAGFLNNWRADARGWISDTALALASPRATVTTATSGRPASQLQLQSALCEDRFVMHMPSAREPQPYAYPGHTAGEIEALEDHGRKARLVGERSEAWMRQQRQLVHAQGPRPMISLAKRSGRSRFVDHEVPSVCGAQTDAALFAPFTSPRTPARRHDLSDTVLQTVRVPGAYQEAVVEPVTNASSPVRRKPVDFRHASIDDCGHEVGPKHGEDIYPSDLRNLPHIRLVRPELASIPHSHNQRPPPSLTRKCSLGCEREDQTGRCVDLARNEISPEPHAATALFHEIRRSPDPHKPEELIASLWSATKYIRIATQHLHIPRSGAFDALTNTNATPQQKVDALKSLLTLTGQGLVLLMAVTLIWRLGTAIAYVLEVLLWPLIVPWKILGWFVGVA